MNELWADIAESPILYQISNFGNVRRKGCELCAHFLAIRKQNQGYKQVSIYLPNGRQVTRMVHRLMAIAFIENPENKPVINHVDGNKSNNSLGNLQWATYSENTVHAYANNLIKTSSGESHWTRSRPELKTEKWRSKKLNFLKASEIRRRYIPRDKINSGRALAKYYGVSQTIVKDIVDNKIWRTQ